MNMRTYAMHSIQEKCNSYDTKFILILFPLVRQQPKDSSAAMCMYLNAWSKTGR